MTIALYTEIEQQPMVTAATAAMSYSNSNKVVVTDKGEIFTCPYRYSPTKDALVILTSLSTFHTGQGKNGSTFSLRLISHNYPTRYYLLSKERGSKHPTHGQHTNI